MSEYVSVALPMLTSQDNEVTYLVPWSHLQQPPKEGGKPRPPAPARAGELRLTLRCVPGVYELVSYQMSPGGPTVWGKDFRAAIGAHDVPGYGKVLAAFHNEFGLLNRGRLEKVGRGRPR